MRATCASCETKFDVPDNEGAGARKPCPRCASTGRVHEASGSLAATVSISSQGRVERGINEIRLALLAVLLTIGLTVGFGVPYTWWVRVLAGATAVMLAAAALRWRWLRHRLMQLMHWLLGGR